MLGLFFALCFGGRFFVFGFVFFGDFGFVRALFIVVFAVLFVIGLDVFVAAVAFAVIVCFGFGFAFGDGFYQLGLAGMRAASDFQRLPCFDVVAFDFVERGELVYIHVVVFGDAV